MSDVALDPDYTLEQVAEALQMSERWVRDRIREGAPHQRYGNKIRFPGRAAACRPHEERRKDRHHDRSAKTPLGPTRPELPAAR